MANKSLGQHWLFDRIALKSIVDSADIEVGETVLEIGPGLGTLTHELLEKGATVVAVEFDKNLIDELKVKFAGKNLTVIHDDILKFDFDSLPAGYKVVANIPYYLTSHLLRKLTEVNNRPSRAVLLVQKEVAERVSALKGSLSLLAVSVQVYALTTLGDTVPAELFSPPPKVDSRVLILEYYKEPIVADTKRFFRVVRAGFSQPRKKLRSSIAGGLGISTNDTEKLLLSASIDPARRAQTLSIDEWENLSQKISQ